MLLFVAEADVNWIPAKPNRPLGTLGAKIWNSLC